MITKFIIEEYSPLIDLKINGETVILNHEYDISDEKNMTATVLERGRPLGKIKFKFKNNNNIISKSYYCTLNVDVNNIMSLVDDIEFSHEHGELVDINTLISFNDSTDRLVCIEKNDLYGDFTIDGKELVLNKVYFLFEFKNVFYKVKSFIQIPNIESNYKFRNFNYQDQSNEYTLTLKSTGNLFVDINTASSLTVFMNLINQTVQTLSAYQLAVQNGFTGTEEEWLNMITSGVDKTYTHIQNALSNTWIINHQLNKYPSVFVVDESNNVIYCNISYVDENNLILNFEVETKGKAFIN